MKYREDGRRRMMNFGDQPRGDATIQRDRRGIGNEAREYHVSVPVLENAHDRVGST